MLQNRNCYGDGARKISSTGAQHFLPVYSAHRQSLVGPTIPLNDLFHACETQRNHLLIQTEMAYREDGISPLEDRRHPATHNSMQNHFRVLWSQNQAISSLRHQARLQLPECSAHALTHFLAKLFSCPVFKKPSKFCSNTTSFENLPLTIPLLSLPFSPCQVSLS